MTESATKKDQPIRIVIVEDSSVQAEVLKRMLVKEGYAVSVAKNGVEGLAMVRDTAPDLVLSDIIMPEMDGFDLCRQIKNDGRFGETPVILLTALNDPKDVIKGLECRADNFIVKPYDEKYLLSRIRYILLSREIHLAEQMDLGIEIYFAGQKYYINSTRQQILNLLLSTYETAVQKNNELLQAQESLKELNERLEVRVAERTASLLLEIDERKRAEEALQVSEERFRNLVETTTDWIWEVDKSSVYTYASPAVSYILGYEPEDVIGKTPFDLMPAEEAKSVAEILGSLVAERKPINYLENINLHKDGRQVILETCGVPFFDRAGIFIGYRGVDRDITERKRAEEAKNRLYEEIKDLYNNAPCGYHSIDAEGAFTRINDTELDWLGYVREEVIGRMRFIDIISLVSRDQYARTHSTLKKNGSPKDVELDLVRKDGTILNALLSESSFRDAGGNLVSSRATIHDISERKILEEQLRQSQKMESIGLLAGGVAHDFNNILTAIYGYCAILQSKMGEDSPFRSEIDHIQGAAERAASLTRGLLAFSRQQIMKPQQVNLNDIVKNIWQLLNRIIGEDIHLETNVSEMPLWIFADSVQIEQVLINLAANARDALPNGGQLTIETNVQAIDEGFMHAHGSMAPGEYAVISLSDNGIGMDAETSKKIFEPFFTTKEEGKGTGLGLSIVYGVIKQHNGYINVYSEPGLGTTFRIYLPVTKAEHVSDVRGVSLPPKGGTETILCAEDDDAIRALVTLTLRSYGYNVITAENGADAVSMFMEHKDEIDLLLFDLIMPKKNGKEASDEIRKLHPGLRTLFMTGYPSDFLQRRGMLEESPDVVMKPISPMDLLRKIREVLDK